VFVGPAANPVHSAAVRIFTPKRELPFAGHPTVGTAVLLATERPGAGLGDSIVILEEQVGSVRCGITLHGDHGHAWFDAPRLPKSAGDAAHKDVIATALGLDPRDIGFENHVPTLYDIGFEFVFVPVANLGAIAKAAPNLSAWQAAFGMRPAYLYTRDTEVVARQFHSRMFGPLDGISEDPATGAAAIGLAGVIQRFDAHPNGNHKFVIEQGFEMGRPSILQLEIDVEGASLAKVRLGGEAVIVARGELLV
jgi:trans-2,3-dihydro-3-hydroxyanthranilate isomerase